MVALVYGRSGASKTYILGVEATTDNTNNLIERSIQFDTITETKALIRSVNRMFPGIKESAERNRVLSILNQALASIENISDKPQVEQ